MDAQELERVILEAIKTHMKESGRRAKVKTFEDAGIVTEARGVSIVVGTTEFCIEIAEHNA